MRLYSSARCVAGNPILGPDGRGLADAAAWVDGELSLAAVGGVGATTVDAEVA
jgi:hypothetical protein